MKSAPVVAGLQIAAPNAEDRTLGIGELIAILMEYRWVICGIAALSILLGAVYLFIATPIYKADGLLQVEEMGGGGLSVIKDLQPLLGDSTTTVTAEQEILLSRMVLGRVIKRLRLDIEVKPVYFPLIGAAVARRYEGEKPNDPWYWLDGYAWGGEALQLHELDVPPNAENIPMYVQVGAGETFELLDQEGNKLLSGRVGARAASGPISISVSNMVARPGTRFMVMRRSIESSVAALRLALSVKERGKKSGILEISLLGPNQEQNGIVLDEILKTYVRQNVERRSAEAESTLKFLETQLPTLKHEMDAAEQAYNSYRQSRGSLDLNLETQSLLQSLVEVDNQIVALRQERDELRQNFTAQHPRVQALDQRIERLQERHKTLDIGVNKLPDTQQKVLRLARDVEVTTSLYTDLLNTAQQLKVSKAGTVGNVRIIDFAAASHLPQGLGSALILALSGLAGVAAGIAAVWLIRSMRVLVEDPEVIEATLGLPVYATIPHSQEEAAIFRRSKEKGGELLAIRNPEDDAIESLRGLRTTIHFALMDAPHNSLLVTGSSPGVGKSFISKNLGAVLANAGQRIVIVDADLRKGHINKEFGLSRDIGVSEYVVGSASLEAIIKPTFVSNLWVVTTGQIPPNPSELLMHSRFEKMLKLLGDQFDTLIVDAPPILAVSDAAIIGRMTGATLMVARAGWHPIAELEQAVKRLNNSGVQVKGFVFNDLNTDRQRYRYGYKGYVYRYSYKSK